MLNRRADAGERLVEIAENAKGMAKDDSARLAWRAKPVAERLSHALVHGINEFIVEDTEEVYREILADGRPPAARDRRAADGRHERRRRPVRPGQDVPAAGRQVGARDEAGGRPPAALHRGREAAADRRRRRGQGEGQDRHRDREGRRPRHRQEHRHRRPPVQQLRGRQHGRDGRLPGHPREGQGRGRRHHRPVRADHAEPRGDAARRRRDAARRLLPHQEDSAADRRRDDEPRPHRGEDRAALRRAGRLRARREPLGRRLQRPAERPARERLHRRAERRLRAGARAACEQEGDAAGHARRGARQQDADRLERLCRAAAEVHRPPRLSQPGPGRDRRLHRLGPVLPDLGPGRRLSGGPDRRDRGRVGAARVQRRPAHAEAPDRRALGAPRTASSASTRRTRSATTTSRSTPTRRAARC